MKKKTVRISRKQYLVDHIEWDNWREAEDEKTGDANYWPVSGVLYARLEAMKELFQDYQKQEGHDEDALEESLDTINLVQVFIDSMPDKVLNGRKFTFDPDEN